MATSSIDLEHKLFIEDLNQLSDEIHIQLGKACKEDNVKEVKKILAQHRISVNIHISYPFTTLCARRYTILIYAILHNRNNLLNFLFNEPTEPKVEVLKEGIDHQGKPMQALDCALGYGPRPNFQTNYEVMRNIIRHDSNINSDDYLSRLSSAWSCEQAEWANEFILLGVSICKSEHMYRKKLAKGLRLMSRVVESDSTLFETLLSKQEITTCLNRQNAKKIETKSYFEHFKLLMNPCFANTEDNRFSLALRAALPSVQKQNELFCSDCSRDNESACQQIARSKQYQHECIRSLHRFGIDMIRKFGRQLGKDICPNIVLFLLHKDILGMHLVENGFHCGNAIQIEKSTASSNPEPRLITGQWLSQVRNPDAFICNNRVISYSGCIVEPEIVPPILFSELPSPKMIQTNPNSFQHADEVSKNPTIHPG